MVGLGAALRGATMEADMSSLGDEPGLHLLAEVRTGQPTIVYLRGEVDFSVAPALRDVLARAVADHPAVIVDVVDATFLDASIVGVLAQANARAEQGIRIRGAIGLVERVFQLTSFEHLLLAPGVD